MASNQGGNASTLFFEATAGGNRRVYSAGFFTGGSSLAPPEVYAFDGTEFEQIDQFYYDSTYDIYVIGKVVGGTLRAYRFSYEPTTITDLSAGGTPKKFVETTGRVYLAQNDRLTYVS